MFNPRKETPNAPNAPYGRSNQPIYPSQSNDYISLNVGGINSPQSSIPFYGRGGVGMFGGNSGGFNMRRNRNTYGDRDLYSDEYNRRPQQQFISGGRYQKRQNSGFNGRQYSKPKKYRGNKNENRDIFSNYFHQSMLEDPWKELVERHEALNGNSFDD